MFSILYSSSVLENCFICIFTYRFDLVISLESQRGTLGMGPSDTGSGLPSDFTDLIGGLSEVECSFLVPLIALSQLGVVVTAEEAFCHLGASVYS